MMIVPVFTLFCLLQGVQAPPEPTDLPGVPMNHLVTERRALRQKSPETPATMETAILNQINAIRVKNGKKPLRLNAALARAARGHSRNMVERNFFDHIDPAEKTVADRVKDQGYDWQRVGENIAMNTNYPQPVSAAVEGWMKSTGHRENILRGEYTETGVGVWKKGNSYYFTQVFATPFSR